MHSTVYRVYSERLTENELTVFKQQFNGLDMDHDGLLTKADLVRALSMAPLLASKMIVHLHKGRKDAKQISFDRFLESRLKFDLAQKTQSIFDEILASQSPSALPGAALVGFESASTMRSPYPSTPQSAHAAYPVPSTTPSTDSECISLTSVTDFAASQFSFKIDFSTGSLEKVFERFGDEDGLLSHSAFAKVMNVRPITDALGLGVSCQ